MRAISSNKICTIIVIIVTQLIVASLSNDCYNYFNDNKKLSNDSWKINCININSLRTNNVYSLKLTFNIQDSYDKARQRGRNKFMHSANGNRKASKIKSHYKVLILNKGNSDFRSSYLNLFDEIQDHTPDLAVIGEANIKTDDDAFTKAFKSFNIESKYTKDCSKARLAVMINKNIQYERIIDLEHDDTASMWIKFKTS